MSTSFTKVPRVRDLRNSPYSNEPSFSEEEDLVENHPSYVREIDNIHFQIDRSNHRSTTTKRCNSGIGSSQQRFTRGNTHHHCCSDTMTSTKRRNCSPMTMKKGRRRKKDRYRAKERSDKLDSLISGSDRGKFVETETNNHRDDSSKVEIDRNGNKSSDDVSNLSVVIKQLQQVVSITPDNFTAMTRLSSTEIGMDKEDSTPGGDQVYRNDDVSVLSCDDAWLSDYRRKVDNTKSIRSSGILNIIDLNPNERMAKLALNDLSMCCWSMPIKDFCGTPLGNTLQQLSLSRNPLREIPPELVVQLPALQKLDVSFCQLHQIPLRFHLPNLRVLNLQNNALTEFPSEDVFTGLPNLCVLVLYCNQLTEITLPTDVGVVSKLEKLDLGFNNILHLPYELDQLKGLRHLNAARNCLTVVPMRICAMKLDFLDVGNNPTKEPPTNICELGLDEMRLYWSSIRTESNSITSTSSTNSSTRMGSSRHSRGRWTLSKSVRLPSMSTISDLSVSTIGGREDSIRHLMHSSSSIITEDRPVEEL